ncbi:TPA: hypothetical protein DCZ15_04285 [Candidatus Falkowbacteria bacterium]|nr:MAG: hypothetical protein UV95_C0001G0317 [Candidatus Falkowbacteria bacterium GW2011_GWF2_43_32]HBA37054.1 hypothetical protein [Candidatus Falkowbacteria bacterium]
MKKINTVIFLSLLLFGLLISPFLVRAQENSDSAGSPRILQTLQNVGQGGGYQTDSSIASTPIIAGTIVGAFIGFAGITFIVLMVIAGYGWMTASGNEEKIKKAQSTIKSALIGLIVSISAWSLWTFVLRRLILMGQ